MALVVAQSFIKLYRFVNAGRRKPISCIVITAVLTSPLTTRNHQLIFGQTNFAEGHGMLLDPVGRSSRWREDRSAPANYDDSGVNCGSLGTFASLGGKCGLCGDDYNMRQPRPHELGGKYGQGVIVKEYNGKYLWVGPLITANHLGHWSVELCNLDKFGSESESCFAEHGELSLDVGGTRYDVGSRTGFLNASAIIPSGTHCNHCVLRWKYVAGNNWGLCRDGSGHLGCGIQETFVSCADIKIQGNVSENTSGNF
ncbi:uncharacterized protein LOC129606448 [Condylostylus longicornis]|uniref:uncharacterized protein LOC129606448 n=1 Tax=Condylostylus longicornis TaxID=2530218 RepID=UPI00244DC7EC|nr:uncharacterized protein LOC129606448 [Condylostylus longicornis]